MNRAQEFVLNFFQTQKSLPLEHRRLAPEERAEAFVLSSFLACSLQSLKEKHWLETHNQSEHQLSFEKFLEVAFQRELKALNFLQPLLAHVDPRNIRQFKEQNEKLQRLLIEDCLQMSSQDYRVFLTNALNQMADFIFSETNLEILRSQADIVYEQRMDQAHGLERQWPQSRATPEEALLPNALHRAFDAMDEIFGIDYQRDSGMKVDLQNKERLFEGAGLGVQSSYYTILTALRESRPSHGSRFIDLGSGYGRVGLVAGVLRPDLEVIGYEYVGHRVELAQSLAEKAGIGERVKFFAQDLSRADFEIPEAEVYYIYDSFSEETYRHVWRQLQDIGKRRSIVIATKGNAGAWFSRAICGQNWSGPELHDTGNLNLFRSLA